MFYLEIQVVYAKLPRKLNLDTELLQNLGINFPRQLSFFEPKNSTLTVSFVINKFNWHLETTDNSTDSIIFHSIPHCPTVVELLLVLCFQSKMFWADTFLWVSVWGSTYCFGFQVRTDILRDKHAIIKLFSTLVVCHFTL